MRRSTERRWRFGQSAELEAMGLGQFDTALRIEHGLAPLDNAPARELGGARGCKKEVTIQHR